jgi:hypothetical protein
MRKLLILVATLSLGTLGWAQLAGNNMISSDQPLSNGSSYSQIVATQAVQNGLINAAVAPSAKAVLESGNFNGEQPGSMAANEAAQSGNWYNQRVEHQAELNSRIMRANQF